MSVARGLIKIQELLGLIISVIRPASALHQKLGGAQVRGKAGSKSPKSVMNKVTCSRLLSSFNRTDRTAGNAKLCFAPRYVWAAGRGRSVGRLSRDGELFSCCFQYSRSLSNTFASICCRCHIAYSAFCMGRSGSVAGFPSMIAL